MALGKHPATGVGVHSASEIEKLYADFYNYKSNPFYHDPYDFIKDEFEPTSPTDEFTLSRIPYDPSQVLVFRNGILQKLNDDYIIESQVITIPHTIVSQLITAIYVSFKEEAP